MITSEAAAVVVAFADDELLIGHRHSEWLGLAPFLEEDLAFASIAQDEIGHARALYALAVSDEVDVFPFRRAPSEFRCAWLTELPGHPWEQALVRHALYDTAEHVRWENLTRSTVAGLGDLAAKALAEEAYHVRHALDMMGRMLGGTDESRGRMLAELEHLLPFALALFESTEGEAAALAEGVLARPLPDIGEVWRAGLQEKFAEWGVTVPWPVAPAGLGARAGARSEHFADALETMTAVFAIDPSARW